MPAATTSQPSNPFIKQLASSGKSPRPPSTRRRVLNARPDRKTRDRALSSLRTYLSRPASFTPLDFLKLWKGLFFCMWMSDKPLNQQRLARDLADLVSVLKGDDNVVGFMDAFWKTMAREWSGIDALRMDKYLYLVRCYLGKAFEVMARKGWQDEEMVERVLGVLQETPLEARDAKIPNGLRFHVVDIYVDELEKVDTEKTAPVEKIMAPVRKLGKETVTKAVRTRVQEALEDERLQDWQGLQSGSGEGDGADEDDEFGGFDE